MAKTKIDIVSGFLGAGKTTLIKKLLKDALAGTKVVLIENEFGEIGIDGGFLKEAGIQIREMNSGCICCSLVGDFGQSLREVMKQYAPERILIEPSGVGKLSDVMRAVSDASQGSEMELNSAVAVVDASKCKMYAKNFGEFFLNQISYAGTVILTRGDKASEEKMNEAVALIREHNPEAKIITTPLAELDGRQVLATIEGGADLEAELLAEVLAEKEEHHHHHHHDDDENEHGEHCHHHHDDDEHDEHCHHNHHDHDEEDEHDEHAHHHHDDEDGHDECCHHHDHDEEHEHDGHHHDHDDEHCHHHDHCGCGHEHHHHHGHDADEVFTSWGFETPEKYTKEEIESRLKALDDEQTYGVVLRAKGMVAGADGAWIHFDYVPGESEVRTGAADVTGKVCVIGSKLREVALAKLFAKA